MRPWGSDNRRDADYADAAITSGRTLADMADSWDEALPQERRDSVLAVPALHDPGCAAPAIVRVHRKCGATILAEPYLARRLAPLTTVCEPSASDSAS